MPVRSVNFRRSALTSLFCSLRFERMVCFKVRSQEVFVMPVDQLRNRTVGSKMTEVSFFTVVSDIGVFFFMRSNETGSGRFVRWNLDAE